MEIEKSAGNRSAKLLLLVFGALFFIYTVIRAYCLSITWDEAFSYLEFVRNGILIPEKYVKMSANNHLLNTALMIFFSKLFGTSAFVLRIPNLLAHLIFLYFSAKLVLRFESKLLIISSFLILNCNPYLLDFFSLARGYGIAFGCIMASLYYLYCAFAEDKKSKHALVSIFFAGLALFANFALLNYFIISVGVLKLYFLFLSAKTPGTRNEKIKLFFRYSGLSLIFALLVLSAVIPILLQLRTAGALFLGENTGFWSATISPLIGQLFYLKPSDAVLEKGAVSAIVLVIVIGLFVCGYKALKKQTDENVLFLIATLTILIFCSFAVILENQYLGTPYLLTRAALFLFLLFAVILVFELNEMIRQTKGVTAVAVFISLLFCVHFCFSANFKFVFEWRYDADTKEMIGDLQRLHGEKGISKIRLGIPMIVDPDVNFYIITEHLDWLSTGWSAPVSGIPCDYLFLPQQVLEKKEKSTYELIKTYPVTQNSLIKPITATQTDGTSN